MNRIVSYPKHVTSIVTLSRTEELGQIVVINEETEAQEAALHDGSRTWPSSPRLTVFAVSLHRLHDATDGTSYGTHILDNLEARIAYNQMTFLPIELMLLKEWIFGSVGR